DGGRSKLIGQQVRTMQAQVQSYLDRARIAAGRATVLARTDPGPVIERLVRVMRRLNPQLVFETAVPAGIPPLAMEQQDVEEVVGNLLDNAAKFAARTVSLRLEPVAGEGGERAWLAIVIEDD